MLSVTRLCFAVSAVVAIGPNLGVPLMVSSNAWAVAEQWSREEGFDTACVGGENDGASCDVKADCSFPGYEKGTCCADKRGCCGRLGDPPATKCVLYGQCLGGTFDTAQCDCPGGACEPNLVTVGAKPKFKGTVTVIADDHLSDWDGSMEPFPHKAVTVLFQLKGRIGTENDLTMAQTYQAVDSPSGSPLFPEGADELGGFTPVDEAELRQLYGDEAEEDAALGYMATDCAMTWRLRRLLGVTKGTPVIVRVRNRRVVRHTNGPSPGRDVLGTIATADVQGVLVDLPNDPCGGGCCQLKLDEAQGCADMDAARGGDCEYVFGGQLKHGQTCNGTEGRCCDGPSGSCRYQEPDGDFFYVPDGTSVCCDDTSVGCIEGPDLVAVCAEINAPPKVCDATTGTCRVVSP